RRAHCGSRDQPGKRYLCLRGSGLLCHLVERRQNRAATVVEILPCESRALLAFEVLLGAILPGEETAGQREIAHHTEPLVCCKACEFALELLSIVKVVGRLQDFIARQSQLRRGLECFGQ